MQLFEWGHYSLVFLYLDYLGMITHDLTWKVIESSGVNSVIYLPTLVEVSDAPASVSSKQTIISTFG